MKTIYNKINRPLKITLSRGKVLRLGPAKEGQIATHDAELKSVKKLLADGALEIVGEGTNAGSAQSSRAGNRSDTRGFHSSFRGKRGDR